MKKYLLLLLGIICLEAKSQAIYQLTSSKVSFFAGTPVEDIDAVSTKSLSFLNKVNGDITISLPIREFHFKRPLMEEHFNENYLESSKFPKAEFKGKINDIDKIDFTSAEPVNVKETGTLTIHGVSKERTLDVTLRLSDNKIQGESKFVITLSEHNIDRPKILWEKIAENVTVTALLTYEPYKK